MYGTEIMQGIPNSLKEHIDAVRDLFVSKMIYEPSIIKMPLSRVNTIFCTNLQEGLYQVICIRALYGLENIPDPLSLSNFQEVICEAIEKLYHGLCYDVLIGRRFCGIFVMLNYSPSQNAKIQNSFSALLEEAKKAAAQEGFQAAVFVGRNRDKLQQAGNSRREVGIVSWRHRLKGTEGVFVYKRPENLRDVSYKEFASFERQIRGACESLSVNDFTSCISGFFSQPDEVVRSEKAFSFLQETKEYMFSANSEELRLAADVEKMYYEFEQSLWDASSLSAYQSTFISQFKQIVDKIEQASKDQRHPAIVFAVNYIQQHYSEELDANMAARLVNLQSAYFSALFKKETGVKFTEFLTKYRIMEAKKLLRETRYSVQEIGRAVGFSDVHYFGKVFRRYTGRTPSDYRSGTSAGTK